MISFTNKIEYISKLLLLIILNLNELIIIISSIFEDIFNGVKIVYIRHSIPFGFLIIFSVISGFLTGPNVKFFTGDAKILNLDL